MKKVSPEHKHTQLALQKAIEALHNTNARLRKLRSRNEVLVKVLRAMNEAATDILLTIDSEDSEL